MKPPLHGPRVAEEIDLGARSERQKESQSFCWGLATWLIRLWRGSELQLAAEDQAQLWRRLVEARLGGDVVVRRLASAISQVDHALAGGYGRFESFVSQSRQSEQSDPAGLSGMELPSEDVQGKLDAMEERLLAMEKTRRSLSPALGGGGDGAGVAGGEEVGSIGVEGLSYWRVHDERAMAVTTRLRAVLLRA
ncbi:LOW QUALITY PROTEIN: hypothetical protein JCM24511_09514 [Saitozyma sp. JCM 24511]|nr:LOW QUALITY PROTEIN: hypothetical protein JCM24511_09514 [Saitozyma sp. JCM 24511]